MSPGKVYVANWHKLEADWLTWLHRGPCHHTISAVFAANTHSPGYLHRYSQYLLVNKGVYNKASYYLFY